MASKKKKATAAAGGAYGAAKAAKDNAYVQRLVDDEDLRGQIQEAYESARAVYERISSGKQSPAKQLLDDKKLQKQLKEAAENVRDASNALRDAPKKNKSGGGLFRKVAVLAVAGGLALALSEDLRKKVLDLLFGAEEEFEYTSTTTPPPPGGASPGGTPEAAAAS